MNAMQTQRDYAAEMAKIWSRSDDEPVAYLYEVDAGTDNACWVVCAKGDPGARPVYLRQ